MEDGNGFRLSLCQLCDAEELMMKISLISSSELLEEVWGEVAEEDQLNGRSKREGESMEGEKEVKEDELLEEEKG
jgi:hypothetical protein